MPTAPRRPFDLAVEPPPGGERAQAGEVAGRADVPGELIGKIQRVDDRVAAFQTRYNAVGKPFNWKFTRSDLHTLLDRIDAHEAKRYLQLAA
jgi:hypothetical protein